MRPTHRVSSFACAALLLGLGACDAASGVPVQPLPPTNRPSAEARAGLPEVAGVWRFAGWELPSAAALEAAGSSLAALGELHLQHQRLDSIAGSYVADELSIPAIGEVRRDRRFALVALGGGDQNRYISGQVARDTLWVELTSLPAADNWPAGTRAAWVRSTPPATPFLRVHGVLPAPAAVDTLPPAPAESAGVPAALPPAQGAPVPTAPARAPAPITPPVREPIGRPVEQPAPPVQRPAPSPVPSPAPESTRVGAPPAQRPARQPTQQPRVLGVPVQPQQQPTQPQPAAPRPVTPRPVVPDTIVTPPPPEPG